jgi:hypothetical protein
MPAKPPERYWRCYGTDPLPTGAEAKDQPFAAFPSWLICITCDRCGKDVSDGPAPYELGKVTVFAQQSSARA